MELDCICGAEYAASAIERGKRRVRKGILRAMNSDPALAEQIVVAMKAMMLFQKKEFTYESKQ